MHRVADDLRLVFPAQFSPLRSVDVRGGRVEWSCSGVVDRVDIVLWIRGAVLILNPFLLCFLRECVWCVNVVVATLICCGCREALLLLYAFKQCSRDIVVCRQLHGRSCSSRG